jgi:hypothetical protein
MRFGFGFFSRSDLARDATGFDAPSADARRFLDVRSIFGHIFSHNKK